VGGGQDSGFKMKEESMDTSGQVIDSAGLKTGWKFIAQGVIQHHRSVQPLTAMARTIPDCLYRSPLCFRKAARKSRP